MTLTAIYPHTKKGTLYHEFHAAYNSKTGTYGSDADKDEKVFAEDSLSSKNIPDGWYTDENLIGVYAEYDGVLYDETRKGHIYSIGLTHYVGGTAIDFKIVYFNVDRGLPSYCKIDGSPQPVPGAILSNYPRQ